MGNPTDIIHHWSDIDHNAREGSNESQVTLTKKICSKKVIPYEFRNNKDQRFFQVFLLHFFRNVLSKRAVLVRNTCLMRLGVASGASLKSQDGDAPII